jgi:DNA invertase Pin-like site-specific DNA recombinase
MSPKILDNVNDADVIRLFNQGLSERAIARQLGCSRSTIYARKQRLNLRRK